MLRTSDVTACLVTRGDVDLRPILDTLIWDNVVVWDNSVREDRKTAGRYYAAAGAKTPVVYYQDDDVLVPRSTQAALLDAYEPGIPTAVYAHGDTPGGYEDVMLVGAGALVPKALAWQGLHRYLDFHPIDDGFLYDCDFVAGTLYPIVKHVRLPFTIEMELAQHPSRLVNQPWQYDLKFDVTQRARAIRDMVKVRAA
jgi:hypothetical protein